MTELQIYTANVQQSYTLVSGTSQRTDQFLRQVSAEPNLFELCRTEQKSVELKLAKEYAYHNARENSKYFFLPFKKN